MSEALWQHFTLVMKNWLLVGLRSVNTTRANRFGIECVNMFRKKKKTHLGVLAHL